MSSKVASEVKGENLTLKRSKRILYLRKNSRLLFFRACFNNSLRVTWMLLHQTPAGGGAKNSSEDDNSSINWLFIKINYGAFQLHQNWEKGTGNDIISELAGFQLHKSGNKMAASTKAVLCLPCPNINNFWTKMQSPLQPKNTVDKKETQAEKVFYFFIQRVELFF